MRFLTLHVNRFQSKITEKGRSKLVEPPEPGETEVGESLVVLASVEKGDERDAALVSERAAVEIASIATNLKTRLIVLHPFAHLFAQLAAPETAVEVMDAVSALLKEKGYDVIRTPFGWFNTLEIDAKGHPYSRMARTVTAEIR